ncbi:hypothetical protein ACQP2X_17290 [Actinoplanes sp. CA-131856]
MLRWRAAAVMGLHRSDAHEAERTGLVSIGVHVLFRHTLVRSALYRSATPDQRREVHRALAEVTDPAVDPDRHAWHRARATEGTDDEVAAQLEASAGRAQARGGLSAAAAFLEQAADLTADPARRADRELAAAGAHARAGATGAASGLLTRAETGPPDELRAARIGLLRGQMAFASGRGADAPCLLLETARRLESLDGALARDTYLEALAAAHFAGRFAGPASVPEVARHVPPAGPEQRPAELLLEGLATLHTAGYDTGVPLVRRAVSVFRDGALPPEDMIRWQYVACTAAHEVWDDDSWSALATRYVEVARAAGALGALPIAVSQLIGLHLHRGRFEAAGTLVAEIEVISEATGNTLPEYGAAVVAAWQGREAVARPLIRATAEGAERRREGSGLSLIHHARAVLANGLSRHAEALEAAEVACAETGFANWALIELIEAAVRVGERTKAEQALDRLTRTTGPSATAWGAAPRRTPKRS